MYASYGRDWQPLSRDKVCGPNLLVNGILSMLSPIVNDRDVTRNTLRIWIAPAGVQHQPGPVSTRFRYRAESGFCPGTRPRRRIEHANQMDESP